MVEFTQDEKDFLDALMDSMDEPEFDDDEENSDDDDE